MYDNDFNDIPCAHSQLESYNCQSIQVLSMKCKLFFLPLHFAPFFLVFERRKKEWIKKEKKKSKSNKANTNSSFEITRKSMKLFVVVQLFLVVQMRIKMQTSTHLQSIIYDEGIFIDFSALWRCSNSFLPQYFRSLFPILSSFDSEQIFWHGIH